jgi:hypothetical protein
MMSYTADGQVDKKLLEARNARYGVNTEDKRRERESLEYPQVPPLACLILSLLLLCVALCSAVLCPYWFPGRVCAMT